MFLSERLRDALGRIEYNSGSPLASVLLSHHYARQYGSPWTATGAYLDYDGTYMSYFPAHKRGEAWADHWNHSVRVSGRVGRITKRFIDDIQPDRKTTDVEVETFVNALAAAYAAEQNAIEVYEVSGQDIASAYDEDDGPDSCMTRMGYYMDIYCENPQSIRLIVCRDTEGDENTLLARSLIFRLNDGQWYRDSIYGSSKYATAIEQYAKAEGYTTSIPSSAVVHVKPKDYDGYPYVDTFRYYNMFDGTLRAHAHNNPTHTLNSTDGDAETHFTICDECHEPTPNDEITYQGSGVYWCESCIDNHRCTECGATDAAESSGYCDSCERERTCSDCLELGTEVLYGGVCDACKKQYTCKDCNQYQGENLSYRDGQCPACWRREIRIAALSGPRAAWPHPPQDLTIPYFLVY